eukprot:6198467-Pleurochrysis_carterae.AAC.1
MESPLHTLYSHLALRKSTKVSTVARVAGQAFLKYFETVPAQFASTIRVDQSAAADTTMMHKESNFFMLKKAAASRLKFELRLQSPLCVMGAYVLRRAHASA